MLTKRRLKCSSATTGLFNTSSDVMPAKDFRRRSTDGIAKLFGVGCDYVCCEFQAVISRV